MTFTPEELDLIIKALAFADDQRLFTIEISKRARLLAERVAGEIPCDPAARTLAERTLAEAERIAGKAPYSWPHADVMHPGHDWLAGSVFHKGAPPSEAALAVVANGAALDARSRPWWLEGLPQDLRTRPRSISSRFAGDREINTLTYRDGTVIEISRIAPAGEG